MSNARGFPRKKEWRLVDDMHTHIHATLIVTLGPGFIFEEKPLSKHTQKIISIIPCVYLSILRKRRLPPMALIMQSKPTTLGWLSG